MKRYSYGERDYAFGQAIVTLRTSVGLTQAGLAELLGVSRHAVVNWEAGSSYPKAHHLKAFLALCVQQQVFPPGREEEEIRAFWKAAHQKVLLDEAWLSAVLKELSPPHAPVPVEEAGHAEEGGAPPPASPTSGALAAPPAQHPPSLEPLASRAPAGSGPRVEWSDALDVPSFYGRAGELATLALWLVQDRCRVVNVLGLGGIGKSALVVQAMKQLAQHFDVVIFRSLRDGSSCETLLESCLQVLSPEAMVLQPQELSARLSLLVEELRRRRVLLVLDNLESLLQAGDLKGRMRPGFEAYGRLLRQVAESGHQSCVLLTSREKPAALRGLEGSKLPMRSLRLSGLGEAAGEKLLEEHELTGSPQERARLVQIYEGNPLALNVVSQTIADLFGGEIRPFLSAESPIFGGIAELLDEQWSRLSPLEQTLLFWLAILREPVTLEEMQAVLVAPLAPMQMLEAMDGLRRRSLIERGQRAGSFTLQSVVLEFVTGRLVSTASEEIRQDRLTLLLSHGLSQAQAREYVRQTQERLLLVPVLTALQRMGQSRAEMEERLHELLSTLRTQTEQAQGYGPANLVTLMRMLRGNLRGLDLSRLALRGVSLQGVEMQDATLAGALLHESVLTEAFDAITAVAISKSGQYWAAAERHGEVRLWRVEQGAGPTLLRVWQAHTNIVGSIAFGPDDRLLASGSSDGSLKLWDVESRALLWSGWHTTAVARLSFAPDGQRIASCGDNASIQLWDATSGANVETITAQGAVSSVAWSPDSTLLANGYFDGRIQVWKLQTAQPATCVQTLSGHTHWVRWLAFAPDGTQLASASWDRTVRLWDVASGRCLHTLEGHTDRIDAVAWSPDGHTVASAGFDHTIWLWDDQEGKSRAVLQGHSGPVYDLAFTPDSSLLLSGSEDQTLRVWDVQSGEPLRVLQGYLAALFDVAWSPDGQRLASAGTDRLVTLWEVAAETLPRVLQGHRWIVNGVDWSPDGQLLVSAGWDNTVRIWNAATGTCTQILQDPAASDTIFYGVTWSPDGHLLASGSYRQGVHVWQMPTGSRRWVGQAEPTFIFRVAWSPDGTRLVGGGGNGCMYMWDGRDGTLLRRLAGHDGAVWSVAWSPDGTWLASGGGSSESGELFVWNVQSGERLHALREPGTVVYALAWNPTGDLLLSGGIDGMLRWWDLHSGKCVRVQQAHQGTVFALKVSLDGSRLASCGHDGAINIWELESGEHLRTLRRDRPYERLNISGIRGLTQAEIATLRALGAVEDASQVEPPRLADLS